MNPVRYGFNGKENDNEVKGEGNSQDYGMRIYDPRVGRFLSVDPLSKKFPFYTPYQFAANKPVLAIDLDGLEDVIYTNSIYNDKIYGKAITLMLSTNMGIKDIITTWNTENKTIKQDIYLVSISNDLLFNDQDGSGTSDAFTVTFDARAFKMVNF